MMNKIKANLLIHRPAISLALMIAFLLLLGAISGFAIGRMDMNRDIANIKDMHNQEVNRMQTANQGVIIYLASRVQELIEAQTELVGEVSKSSKEAKDAAKRAGSAAKSASINAAKSAIRIREIPYVEPTTPAKPFIEEYIEP